MFIDQTQFNHLLKAHPLTHPDRLPNVAGIILAWLMDTTEDSVSLEEMHSSFLGYADTIGTPENLPDRDLAIFAAGLQKKGFVVFACTVWGMRLRTDGVYEQCPVSQ